MTLIPGTRLGAYEVVVQLGVGGMGEVYRATDTTLKRQVALKVLPASVASDADRLARFQREAEVLAALNHPNIAAIYGIERSGDMTALVMELVEGEDLSQRIARGAIPLDEALPIAKQIAEALEAAHEQGIIHRDLKPANIKVRSDGTVKVLDFGLAKAIASEGASGANDAMNSPTITSPAMMTGAGMILGTAAYMSPEQAKGKLVDKRTDVWAFGCVLFEMLTGKRAFAGENVTDTLAAIVRDAPDGLLLPAETPAQIRKLLRRSLEKDLTRRLQAIGDARIQIDEVLHGETDDTASMAISNPASADARKGRRLARVGWTLMSLAAAGLFLALLVGVPSRQARPTGTRPIRFTIALPSSVTWTSFRGSDVLISPDGARLAFVAAGQDSRSRLWVRSFESLEATPLPGTENAISPFWSPDARFLAFFADGKLKRIDLAGAPTPQTVGTVPDPIGGTWNPAGAILIGSRSGLFRIAATGGEPVAVLSANGRSDASLQWPHFLPDGRHFTYVVSSADENRSGVFIGNLDSSTTKRIMAGDSNVVYAPPGYLMFARGATLMAHAIDLNRLELTGDAFPVAEHVARGLPITGASFSVSDTGVLVYRTADGESGEQLVWLDRAGRTLSTVGAPGSTRVPMLSRDGSTIVVDRVDPDRGTRDIWSIDVSRGFSTRLSSHPANDFAPLLSPDRKRVVFASGRDGPQAALYEKGATSGAADELLLGTGGDKRPNDWSPDGRHLLYSVGAGELWVLPMLGERRPVRFSQTDVPGENRGRFSPDGHWIAYDSSVSGRPEVYVRRFPSSGQEWRVSTNGGFHAQWRGDGRELFYLNLDYGLVAVPVKSVVESTSALGPRFETAASEMLFKAPLGGNATVTARARSAYAVTADGRRFLFARRLGDASSAPITVVLNWTEELKRLVPTK